MRFTVLRSKAVHVRFVTDKQKTICLQHVNGTLFFPDFLSALKMV